MTEGKQQMVADRSQTDIVLLLQSFVLCLQYGYYQNGHILSFRICGSQIDIVRIIFQACSPYFRILPEALNLLLP